MNKNCFNANVNIKEINRIFEYNNTEMLTLTVKYPELHMGYSPCVEWIVNNQIAMEVNGYIMHVNYLYNQAIKAYTDSKTENYPFHPYEAYMEYTITYNDNCFFSLYIDKYEFTGGAHGSTIRSSNTWELCNGTNPPLNIFFMPGMDYINFLEEEIIKQAEYNYNQNPNNFFDDYKNLITQNFNPNSFYLDPQGLVIYYQQYDIAPYSTGIVEFTIPYETIGWSPGC